MPPIASGGGWGTGARPGGGRWRPSRPTVPGSNDSPCQFTRRSSAPKVIREASSPAMVLTGLIVTLVNAAIVPVESRRVGPLNEAAVKKPAEEKWKNRRLVSDT